MDTLMEKKDVIIKLYLEDGLTIKEIIPHISSPEFIPSESSIRRRLRYWGIRKNYNVVLESSKDDTPTSTITSNFPKHKQNPFSQQTGDGQGSNLVLYNNLNETTKGTSWDSAVFGESTLHTYPTVFHNPGHRTPFPSTQNFLPLNMAVNPVLPMPGLYESLPPQQAGHLQVHSPGIPSALEASTSPQTLSRRRCPVACQSCRKRKIRCSGPGSNGRCGNCTRSRRGCTFSRVSSFDTALFPHLSPIRPA
ncbi:uncharacterized protein BDV14DRAFT_139997 [Aspergillus stella-maris]|uniref:uncharacterized protein n=1 Tax=Aspergillus stella-maris TaxID=1810926 RepID=UPI003CCD5DCE